MGILKNNKAILPFSTLLVIQGISGFAQQNNQRPNIIFIMSDDHAAKAISCYDGSINNTPNIDRIAQNGVRFSNCFCTNAVSGPSRATILSGQLSHRNGMINNEVVFDSSQLTLPKVLRSNGYQTAIFGKWHLKSNPSGFDFWKITPGQGEYFNPDFIVNGEKVNEKGYITDIITDNAIEWIKQRDQSKAFFIMIHNKAPHRPWLPKFENITLYDTANISLPENFFDDYLNRADAAKSQKMSVYKDLQTNSDLKIPDTLALRESYFTDAVRLSINDRKIWDSIYYQRNKTFLENPPQGKELAIWKYRRYLNDYLATIKTVDDNVGKVLDYLKANGLEDNTIVIYTSDQGFFLGEHGWFDKRFMYDESYRMPLLIQYPAKIKGNTTNNQMLMNLDFAPTLLEWAGVQKPQIMQGQSFASNIDKNVSIRKATYYHYYEYPGEHHVKRHYGIRTEKYKLIHYYFDIDQWELFDLEKDPHEMVNVYNSPEYKEIQEDIAAELNKMRIEFGDTNLNIISNNSEVSNKILHSAYSLQNKPSDKYSGKKEFPLTDGIIENLSSTKPGFSDAWIGFQKDNLNLTLNINEKLIANEIEIRFLNLPESWIFQPKSVEITITSNKNKTIHLANPLIIKQKRATGGEIISYKAKITEKNIKQIIIKAVNQEVCPAGHPGEGNPAWLFTDELIVR